MRKILGILLLVSLFVLGGCGVKVYKSGEVITFECDKAIITTTYIDSKTSVLGLGLEEKYESFYYQAIIDTSKIDLNDFELSYNTGLGWNYNSINIKIKIYKGYFHSVRDHKGESIGTVYTYVMYELESLEIKSRITKEWIKYDSQIIIYEEPNVILDRVIKNGYTAI